MDSLVWVWEEAGTRTTSCHPLKTALQPTVLPCWAMRNIQLAGQILFLWAYVLHCLHVALSLFLLVL